MRKTTTLFSVALAITLFATPSYALFGLFGKGRTITVHGQGKASFKPTQGQFYMSSTNTAPTADVASSQNAQRVLGLRRSLQTLGLKQSQIRLGQASTRPNYVRDANGRRTNQIENWTTSQSVQVKVPFKGVNNLIGRVYGLASEHNVTINGPSPIVSEKSMDKANARARVKAVSNALNEARCQASAAGCRLGKMLEVKPLESGGNYYRGTMEMATARSAAPAATPPEFSGPEAQSVTQSVMATFRLK